MEKRVEEYSTGCPTGTISAREEAQLRIWAKRLCVTPDELREMIEEDADLVPPMQSA